MVSDKNAARYDRVCRYYTREQLEHRYNKESDFLKEAATLCKVFSKDMLVERIAFSTRGGRADLFCCLDGRFLTIELKAEDGHASELQKEFAEKVRRAGGVAVIVDTLIGMTEALMMV